MSLPRPAPGQARWWVIGILGVLAMTAAVAWLGWSNTAGAVHPQVTAYAVESDSSVRLDYQVIRPEGSTLTCELTALNVRKGAVGTVTEEVPPGPNPAVRSVTIRTTERAVTGVVTSCVRH